MHGEERKISARTRFFRIVVFLFLWLMTGFTVGTSTLMGPVRWLAGLGRAQGWAAGTEDILVKAVIVAFVGTSFLLALWLSRTISRSQRLHVKIGIPVLSMLFALSSLYLWLNPRLAGSDAIMKESSNARFTFGPYPEEEDLVRLKLEGYTAVISLLHPAVVPFEPVLQDKEEQAARRVGIKIIHLPMLPWVSENENVLDSIRVLASSDKGRYYVHCYLGKDRVNVVRGVVESEGVMVSSKDAESPRSLSEIGSFERGPLVKLDEDVWLAPYPTNEEWFGYVLAGQFKSVLSLLDPENPEDTSWITKEKGLAATHGITLEFSPVPAFPFDPEAALDAVDKAHKLRKPLFVHAFLLPSVPGEAFEQAYRSGKPPLPPTLFRDSLPKRRMEIIAPNAAAGPAPGDEAFVTYLRLRGVRSCIYLEEGKNASSRNERRIVENAGLSFEVLGDTSELFEALASGGPYYVYGGGIEALKQSLLSRSTTGVPESAAGIHAAPKEPAGRRQTGVIQFVLKFLKRALPGPKMIILLAPLLLLYAGICGWFSGRLRVKRNVNAPYTRKVFHFLIFTMAAFLQVALGLPAVVLFGSIVSLAVVYAVIRGNGYMFYEAMARPSDEPRRALFVIIPLLSTILGGVTANLFFSQYSTVGYLVAGWGDAVGEPVGTRWGKHRYNVLSFGKVKAQRSLEGSTAILIVGTLVAFPGLLLLGIPALTALWVAAVAGAVGAVVEAFSNHGLDNLFVQVAVTAAVWLLLK